MVFLFQIENTLACIVLLSFFSKKENPFDNLLTFYVQESHTGLPHISTPSITAGPSVHNTSGALSMVKVVTQEAL